MIRVIKLMPDYGGTVLWGGTVSEIGPIDLDSLPISADLRKRLRAWGNDYDNTLDHSCPPNSGFANSIEEAAFEVEGQRLWEALQAELGPEYKVNYFSTKENRLYE